MSDFSDFPDLDADSTMDDDWVFSDARRREWESSNSFSCQHCDRSFPLLREAIEHVRVFHAFVFTAVMENTLERAKSSFRSSWAGHS